MDYGVTEGEKTHKESTVHETKQKSQSILLTGACRIKQDVGFLVVWVVFRGGGCGCCMCMNANITLGLVLVFFVL